MAATEDWFKIKLPTGQSGFIESNDVTDKITGIKKTTHEMRLLDFPDSAAPAKALIPKGENLKIAGSFNGYHFTEYNDLSGWVSM